MHLPYTEREEYKMSKGIKKNFSVEELKAQLERAREEFAKAEKKAAEAEKKYKQELDRQNLKIFGKLEKVCSDGGFTVNEVIALAEYMRDNKLTPAELSGGVVQSEETRVQSTGHEEDKADKEKSDSNSEGDSKDAAVKEK